MSSAPDDRFREIYRRAVNPDDPMALRNLFLGRVEAERGAASTRPEFSAAWRACRVRREVDDETILTARSTPRFIKELFNWYFRDDLYGSLRSADHLILSSGSVDEEQFGLPSVLKQTLVYALDRDWYGYSDSRGRGPAREAIAELENARIAGAPYGAEHVAISMGGTFAVSAVADFVLDGSTSPEPALCAMPNYPPLVEAVARRHPVRLVALNCAEGRTSLKPLIGALLQRTPAVLLQTVTNPTGTTVDETELAELIAAAGPDTMIILDECHECLGPEQIRSASRADPRVIRINSMSKGFAIPGLKVGWIVASSAFIAEFYEYASSSYGGPPSFYYTLVEVAARLERMLLLGITPARRELAMFDGDYGLTMASLTAAWHAFQADRCQRSAILIRQRQQAAEALAAAGAQVVAARYSMNLAVALGDDPDGYRTFRDVLDAAGVAVLPGILTFCLGGGWVRITSARHPGVLTESLRKLSSYLTREGVDGDGRAARSGGGAGHQA
ncbi:pyridoxal phosphate-dependent aminotransferase [Paractinoplanes hotanensis]|uniref:Aminotransferase class I/II-fold pyridoxal phosphate-dependent enzyme n=1 Tax=Paractinoplanes hotanensis TaxID=2906497 RepID=A0ABT0YCR4_9ACTN|nr:aminotransferase class I/II-fold pyridoxal phosphate-dependent enzyme [Actinoplanes hotanensis]MCM4083540.1 aminotransferase class I/II-fold pyridoxal phosphate-dependent enzyme [Actinoplanes hotanensis]